MQRMILLLHSAVEWSAVECCEVCFTVTDTSIVAVTATVPTPSFLDSTRLFRFVSSDFHRIFSFGQNMAMRVISPQHVLLTSGTVVRFNNVGITGTKSLFLFIFVSQLFDTSAFLSLLFLCYFLVKTIRIRDLVVRCNLDMFFILCSHSCTHTHTCPSLNTQMYWSLRVGGR